MIYVHTIGDDLEEESFLKETIQYQIKTKPNFVPKSVLSILVFGATDIWFWYCRLFLRI